MIMMMKAIVVIIIAIPKSGFVQCVIFYFLFLFAI